jgi:hypothetical protein
MPESYGTLSHLWASVVHESAPARPATQSCSVGTAAAHSPNAPSTWSHAFGSPRTISTISGSGSKDPVFTLPACAQTMVGPSMRASVSRSASARIRPCSSAATRCTLDRPSPSICSDAKIVTWLSSLVTTAIGGAPMRPSSSTFQPAFSSTAWRAAASAVKLAIVAPVANPTLEPAGSPKMSISQLAAISSTTAAAGDRAYSPAFWSQVLVSQSAARAAGTPPPTTNPK